MLLATSILTAAAACASSAAAFSARASADNSFAALWLPAAAAAADLHGQVSIQHLAIWAQACVTTYSSCTKLLALQA